MNTEIDRKIAVIFVADVVGYSKHMEKDENATIRSYNACEKILNKLSPFMGSSIPCFELPKAKDLVSKLLFSLEIDEQKQFIKELFSKR